jgi:hypothetical protein
MCLQTLVLVSWLLAMSRTVVTDQTRYMSTIIIVHGRYGQTFILESTSSWPCQHLWNNARLNCKIIAIETMNMLLPWKDACCLLAMSLTHWWLAIDARMENKNSLRQPYQDGCSKEYTDSNFMHSSTLVPSSSYLKEWRESMNKSGHSMQEPQTWTPDRVCCKTLSFHIALTLIIWMMDTLQKRVEGKVSH